LETPLVVVCRPKIMESISFQPAIIVEKFAIPEYPLETYVLVTQIKNELFKPHFWVAGVARFGNIYKN
jgi:hypothetical protein